MQRIGVIGAGAWGTALALAARRAGREVVLWARNPETVRAIQERHESPRLPGIALDPAIVATSDLERALSVDPLVLAVPAQQVRVVSRGLPGPIPLVIVAKGFETATGLRLSEVVAEVRGGPIAVLSGPSFAREVAQGLPTAVTLACADGDLGRRLAEVLGSHSFRCYWSEDVVGVEIGGAVKNVLAIASGIVMGRELGENARAALIARGLAELVRLGAAMGAKPETLMGLSGLGDLVLTCSSLTSRNTSFGYALARGDDPRARPGGAPALAEGVFTAAAVARLAARLGIEMPICAAVDAILDGRLTIDAAIDALLARAFKRESVG